MNNCLDNKARPILIADDDEDDRLLTIDALRECGCQHDIHWVENGSQVVEYILRSNNFSSLADSALPSFILLDLNMPLKDGRQALVELKGYALPETVPVVIFTTSNARYDIDFTFQWGAHFYVTKPSRYRQIVDVARYLLSLDLHRRVIDIEDFVLQSY